MKRFNKLLFVFFLLVSACSPDPTRPIIPEKDMVNILREQYLMQSAISQCGVGKRERPSFYYNQILEKYHYTEADFDSSVVWYSSHLDVYEQIYDSLLTIFRAMEDSIVPLAAEEAKKGVDLPVAPEAPKGE